MKCKDDCLFYPTDCNVCLFNAKEKPEPKPGEVYRHKKGTQYEIVCIADHTEHRERLVIYRPVNECGKIYARPLHMFMDEGRFERVR